MNASEVKRQYAKGRRDFRGVVARNADFSETNLAQICFDGADLSGSRFCSADLSRSDEEKGTRVN
jgi:uncharacterized protein YjbI with pentapeptide repeats